MTGIADPAARPAMPARPWDTPGAAASSGPSGPPAPAGEATSTADWVASSIGALSLLAGSTALSAVLVGHSWVLPLVEVVLVTTLLGVGGRLVRLPSWAVVLLQVAGLAVALTALFTTAGIGGVLPNSAAVGQAHALLSGAWQQIVAQIPPAPSTPELSFLVTAAVGLAAVIVDFLIAAAKAPALVALPLLCLYSVPASIDTNMLPWFAFAAPVAAYALLLAVAGHPSRHAGMRVGVGIAAHAVAVVGAAVAVALVVAGSVTAIGTTGRLPRTEATQGQIGLSPFTALRGNLQRGAAVPLMTVSGLTQPDYLRTIALTTWTSGQGFTVGSVRSDLDAVSGSLPDTQPVSPADQLDPVRVESTAFRDNYLPLYADATAVTGLTSAWAYDSSLHAGHRADATNPGTYSMAVDPSKPTVGQLQADTATAAGALTDVGALPDSVRQLARRVTATAPTAFDKAQALQQYFTDPANGFTYTLTVPVGDSGDALVDFLQLKKGFCEQYASAMAVMLRAVGVPARVGIGFTQGVVQPDGTDLITSHDAHAWVEVAFDHHGWVRFDPTPLVNGQGGQQGFAAPVAQSTPAATPSQAPTTSVSEKSQQPDGGDSVTATTTEPTTTVAAGPVRETGWRVALLILAGLIVLVLVLLGPSAARGLQRRRRLRTVRAGGAAAASAAWTEIEAVAVDHAVAVAPTEPTRSAVNRLARQAQLGALDRQLLRAVVEAAESEWYAPAGTAPTATAPASAGLSSGGDGPRGGAAAGPAGAASPNRSGGLAVADRAAAEPRVGGDDLVRAVTSLRTGLQTHVRLGPVDRWFPRSLRVRRG